MYSKHRHKDVQMCAWARGPLLLLLLLLLDSALGRAAGPGPAERLRGRTVMAQWISGGRSRRDLESSTQQKHPTTGEILLSSTQLHLLLQLHHNHELLSADFTETFYSPDGQPVTISSDKHTDHCFYQGHVRGHPDSWVALSTCSGIRGLISLNSSETFYVEPVEGVDPRHHSLVKAEQPSLTGGSCGHQQHHTHSAHFLSTLSSLHSRVKRNIWGTTKYLELYIVADNTLFKQQNRDYEKTKTRIMEIANYVDKFYRTLNIRVPLIGLEVWTDRDQCIISKEPNATLWSFLQWRQKLKTRKKHDNAQLLTGVIFRGTTIGMAPLEGMCSLENSGGINVDHSELSIGAAATMAHEIGHNFGMSHDHDGCCVEASAEEGGCVMAAATGHPFPRVFSRCSKHDLDSYFQKGGGMCLYNMPNMKDLVGGKKCGNGFVEDGEECDCGEPAECTNDCCNSNNCTLKVEAQCAHGFCCEGCRLKQAGTMCRSPAGACDLPEYCTGASPYCPANVYLLDGSLCQRRTAYCYNGMCLTHQQQCLQLWGYGARPAHDACFEDVNAAGNAFGNCGKDENGNYMKCDKSDAKCGKIQCLSAAKKPKGTNAVSIDTTIRTDGVEVKCRGTYVYSTQDGQGDLPDPGLVLTGTKCGEGKACRDRRCQNASFTELETCITRCHGNGVCNSNGNCHCNSGWAPPFCDKPGLGGSVDSGPVQYDSQVGLVLGLVFVFLLVLPAVLLFSCCSRIRTSCLHQFSQRHSSETKSEVSEGNVLDSPVSPGFSLQAVGGCRAAAGQKVPHTTKELLPLKPGPVQNGTQPVNVVRPLKPAHSPQKVHVVRPPPPIRGNLAPAANSPRTPQRLSPPQKPLPHNPVLPSPVAADLPSWPPLFPPQRPLPLTPLRVAQLTVGSKTKESKASPGLLVMMPPSAGAKLQGKISARPSVRALRFKVSPPPPLRPVPGAQPNTASSQRPPVTSSDLQHQTACSHYRKV